MCGRFAQIDGGGEMAESLGAAPPSLDLKPRYNIAPTQNAAIIRRRPGSPPSLDLLRWGLIPSWAKESTIGSRMINARVETVAEKPAFRSAYASRRCLVPADGFYEWRRRGRSKQPFFIGMDNRKPFAFAGLWETWTGADAAPIETFTILTTAPNALVAPIHDRMPLILHPDDYAPWLDPMRRDPGAMRLCNANGMTVFPVGPFVNSPQNDGPHCLEPPSVKRQGSLDL